MDANTIKKVLEPYLTDFTNKEGYFEDDKRCIQYFNHNPANVDAKEVVLKISAMDHTEVDDLVNNRQMVADHIVSLDIDNGLQKGSPEIVHHIADIQVSGKKVNLYAFATRYCNWHNMEAYPIYDMIMEGVLELYMEKVKNEKISEKDFFHYPRYKEILTAFRNSLDLVNLNFKEIDKFFWINGKKIITELKEHP